MATPLIAVDNVARVYRIGDIDVHALAGVSLTVERGEFVAIMGSSGSGKSTLMAVLGCLDRPSSGRYLLDGIDVAGLDEPDLARIRSERIGFVFQSFNLLPRTSATENASLPLFYSGTAPSGGNARLDRARDALGMLGLGERAKNTPGQLSGGEQQRVAIARALINSPSLLLADEPTGNLDTRNSHEIMDTLVRLNRQEGVTVILVTHEADIAAYADRVVTMRDGRILSDRRNPPRSAETAESGSPPDLSIFRPRLGNAGKSGSAEAPWAFGLMIVAAALQALGRNKMRSALTMLGVFIGVAALIAMVALGRGADEAVRRQIESLGTNVVVILPGALATGGMRGGFGSASTLRVEDARAIARESPAVAQVGYLIRQQGQVQFGSQNWTTNIQGISPNYPPITNWRLATGRAISAEDNADAALVTVIGQTVYRQLFASSDNPLDAIIQVKGVPLRVIGVLAAKGQSPFGQDQDDLVMTPFTTAERKVLGVAVPTLQQAQFNWAYLPPPNPYNLQPRMTGFANMIFVQAASPAQVQTAIDQITKTLQRRHRIRQGEVNDFNIRNLSQFVETAESSSRIMAILLASVASISLLVGGIGIMNILLVSVTERTREIGLRMAIGARRLHVLLQFLAEAILLSLVGGGAGVLFGVTVSAALPLVAGWQAPISALAIFGGFAFSAAVGIFFGYYPARKAARLDPVDALRYE